MLKLHFHRAYNKQLESDFQYERQQDSRSASLSSSHSCLFSMTGLFTVWLSKLPLQLLIYLTYLALFASSNQIGLMANETVLTYCRYLHHCELWYLVICLNHFAQDHPFICGNNRLHSFFQCQFQSETDHRWPPYPKAFFPCRLDTWTHRGCVFTRSQQAPTFQHIFCQTCDCIRLLQALEQFWDTRCNIELPEKLLDFIP